MLVTKYYKIFTVNNICKSISREYKLPTYRV